MMHKYELWLVVQREGKDVAAKFETKIELDRPTEENILALLYDTEYVEQYYAEDGNVRIPIFCTKRIDGSWRVDSGGTAIIELRPVL